MIEGAIKAFLRSVILRGRVRTWLLREWVHETDNKEWILEHLGELRESTALRWDRAARRWNRVGKLDSNYGDHWNATQVSAMVPVDETVNHIDRRLLEPFLSGVNATVLEIGSGGGRFTERILPKCEVLISSDTSPEMQKLVRERFANRQSLRSQVLDGHGLTGIADESVDKVVSLGVFVHLDPWDLYMYLTEIRRVLKPSGSALIEYPNTFTEFGWKRFIFDLDRNVNFGRRHNSFIPLDVSTFENYAIKAGLKIVTTDTQTIPRNAVSTLSRAT